MRRRPLWLVGALGICTWGFYLLLWLGLTWSEMKRELNDDDMHPFWHVLTQLVPFYSWERVHAHFALINDLLDRVPTKVVVFPGAVVTATITANVVGVAARWLSTPVLDLVFFLVPLLLWTAIIVHGQRGLNAYWDAVPDRISPVTVHWAEAAVLVIGGLITAIALWGFQIQIAAA
jgi:hypothetical protein